MLADHADSIPSAAEEISVTSFGVASRRAKPFSSVEALVKLLKRDLLKSRLLFFEGEGKILRAPGAMIPDHRQWCTRMKGDVCSV